LGIVGLFPINNPDVVIGASHAFEVVLFFSVFKSFEMVVEGGGVIAFYCVIYCKTAVRIGFVFQVFGFFCYGKSLFA